MSNAPLRMSESSYAKMFAYIPAPDLKSISFYKVVYLWFGLGFCWSLACSSRMFLTHSGLTACLDTKSGICTCPRNICLLLDPIRKLSALWQVLFFVLWFDMWSYSTAIKLVGKQFRCQPPVHTASCTRVYLTNHRPKLDLT